VPSSVFAIVESLMPTTMGGQIARFHQLADQLVAAGPGMSPDDLTEAIEELAPILASRPQGAYSRLAVIAGAYVEWGGSARALAPDTAHNALKIMQERVEFTRLWPALTGGEPEPTMQHRPRMDELTDRFTNAAHRLGISEQRATEVAISWYDAEPWVNLMVTLMTRREFRDAAPLLAEIGETARQLGDAVPRAQWLPGLAQVLDDEPVVVMDHATGRGFRLTMSGVGDNHQLHTLLADRLIGDPAEGLLEGERPRPEWVAAATTAHPTCGWDNPIYRRFRLFDGTGAYIAPEGRPADIALIEGVRLLVLHPPYGNRGWTGGRTYQGMVPELTLDHIMTTDEANRWRAHIAPARETDLFGQFGSGHR
jgi:hypothetical protein